MIFMAATGELEKHKKEKLFALFRNNNILAVYFYLVLVLMALHLPIVTMISVSCCEKHLILKKPHQL
jgi:hypothetical protein